MNAASKFSISMFLLENKRNCYNETEKWLNVWNNTNEATYVKNPQNKINQSHVSEVPIDEQTSWINGQIHETKNKKHHSTPQLNEIETGKITVIIQRAPSVHQPSSK